MKKIMLFLGLCAALQIEAKEPWAPQGEKIRTEWADRVTPDNVWQSYPRPQLKRAEWMNLNGLWNYSVTPQQTTREQVAYDGQILVPPLPSNPPCRGSCSASSPPTSCGTSEVSF